MGQKAREMIIKDFSLEKHLASWSNIFDSVYGKGTTI
jgi:hypothetical protein